MPLIRLRHKTQWWEANLRVGQFWVPNTFLRLYLNSKPIFLVVRSKGPSSRGCYIYGSKTIAKTKWQLWPPLASTIGSVPQYLRILERILEHTTFIGGESNKNSGSGFASVLSLSWSLEVTSANSSFSWGFLVQNWFESSLSALDFLPHAPPRSHFLYRGLWCQKSSLRFKLTLRINFLNLSKVQREEGESKVTHAIDQEKNITKITKLRKRIHTSSFFITETLVLIPFLLAAEGLALVKSFKVKSPWKMGGISPCWALHSPKFLIHYLMPAHHDLNLGASNLAREGEVKETSEPNITTLIMLGHMCFTC